MREGASLRLVRRTRYKLAIVAKVSKYDFSRVWKSIKRDDELIHNGTVVSHV